MKRHHPKLIAASLSAVILVACSASDPPPAPSEASQSEAPAASQAPSEPVTSTPALATPAPEAPTTTDFAAAPAKGWIIRSNCRMGACNWYRFEQIERTGGDQAPNYNLQLTAGGSTHPEDPYPYLPDDVEIKWQPAAATAEVMCSKTAPYAAVEDDGELLNLNPLGVPGVAQGLANLYFATCHGEYGNDAELAKKFGYDVR